MTLILPYTFTWDFGLTLKTNETIKEACVNVFKFDKL